MDSNGKATAPVGAGNPFEHIQLLSCERCSMTLMSLPHKDSDRMCRLPRTTVGPWHV